MVDCHGCEREKLRDLNTIFRLLDELPTRIRMTKITAPYVFHYNADNPKDSGITGMVVIAESHISVHTFPEKGYLTLDVYSCADFKAEEVLAYLKEVFNPTEINHRLVMRGKKEYRLIQ